MMERGIMSDPSSFFATKIFSMLGGFLGGAAILTFIKPQSIGEAFVRGSVSTGSAMIFSIPLLDFLQMSNNWENQMMAGFCIGFVAYSILGMVANFLKNNHHKDIIETIKDLKK